MHAYNIMCTLLSQLDDLVDLDSLLIQLRSQVTPKWKEFGLVLGIATEVLDKYSSYSPEECIVEMLDYWLRYHHTYRTKPTWRDIAKALKEVELYQLAESILSVYETGKILNKILIKDDQCMLYVHEYITCIGQLSVQVDMNAIPENFPLPSGTPYDCTNLLLTGVIILYHLQHSLVMSSLPLCLLRWFTLTKGQDQSYCLLFPCMSCYQNEGRVKESLYLL